MPQDEQQAGLIPLRPPANAARAKRMLELYKKILGLNPWELELQRMGSFEKPAWKKALGHTLNPADLRSFAPSETMPAWRKILGSRLVPKTFEFSDASQGWLPLTQPYSMPYFPVAKAFGEKTLSWKVFDSPNKEAERLLRRSGLDILHLIAPRTISNAVEERTVMRPDQSLVDKYAWLKATLKKPQRKK